LLENHSLFGQPLQRQPNSTHGSANDALNVAGAVLLVGAGKHGQHVAIHRGRNHSERMR